MPGVLACKVPARTPGSQLFLLMLNAWHLCLFVSMVGTSLTSPLSVQSGRDKPAKKANSFRGLSAAVVPGCYYWCKFVLYRITPEKSLKKEDGAAGHAVHCPDSSYLHFYRPGALCGRARGNCPGKYVCLQRFAYLLVPTVCAAFRTRLPGKRLELAAYCLYIPGYMGLVMLE